jgi:hypothetical protein
VWNKPKNPKRKKKMADLIDRISGADQTRPKLNMHRFTGAWRLYALGEWTRPQLATEFDLQGAEATQAGQVADIIDSLYSVNSHMLNSGNLALTNMPLALTELGGVVHRRINVNFAQLGQVRLSCRLSTAGVAAAVLFAQYSTDESAWNTLTANSISLFTPLATKVTAWEAIPAGAKVSDVFVRLVTQSGDGAADPVVGNVYLETKNFLDRAIYIMRLEAISFAIEDSEDRLYHDGAGVVNKAKVYEDMLIAG